MVDTTTPVVPSDTTQPGAPQGADTTMPATETLPASEPATADASVSEAAPVTPSATTPSQPVAPVETVPPASEVSASANASASPIGEGSGTTPDMTEVGPAMPTPDVAPVLPTEAPTTTGNVPPQAMTPPAESNANMGAGITPSSDLGPLPQSMDSSNPVGVAPGGPTGGESIAGGAVDATSNGEEKSFLQGMIDKVTGLFSKKAA